MKKYLDLIVGIFLWSCPFFLWAQPLTINFTTNNISCFGGNDACITANVTGSQSAQVRYLWSTGDTTKRICGLVAGQYSVTVTGTGGSVVNDTIVTEPAVLVSSIDSIEPVTCDGGNNGFINLSVSGGSAPYHFSWSNGEILQNIANLPADNYTVTISDNNGCFVIDTALVPVLGRIGLTIDSTTNPLCNGGNTGAISVSATAGSSSNCSSSVVRLNEFLYRPSHDFRNGQEPNTGEYIELIGPPGTNISGYILADGDWTITIPAGTTIPSDGLFTIGNDIVWGAGTFDLDAENCNCFTEGTGGQSLLILTDGGETISLFDNTGTFIDGVAYGNPSSGNQPYGATVSTVGLSGSVNRVTFPNASAYSTAIGGLDTMTSLVRDPDGSGNWTPQVGGSLNACNNTTGVGAGGAITYLWNNNATTRNLTGIAAGTYTVTATNALGCTDILSVTLTEPNPITTNSVGIDILCEGDTTGEINLNVVGGTLPYTFAWSNGASTEDLINIAAGAYCATITDANGCMATLCDTLQESSLSISVDTVHICEGDSVQLLASTIRTGIRWSPAGSLSNDTIVNPWAYPAGTTTYVASYTNGCTATDTIVVVMDGGTSLVSLDTVISPNCFGDTTGSIVINSNRTGLTYLWSNNNSTANLTNVPAGVYTLVAAISSICTDTLTVTLTQPNALQLTMGTVTNVICKGGNTGAIGRAVVSGGTTAYTYLWSDAAASTMDSLSNVSAGNYTLTVTDANGCTAIGNATVNEPVDTISIGHNATTVSCNSTNDGSITALPINGIAPYTYQWDVAANNQTTATATNLTTGTYSVVVTDANGCTATAIGIFVPESVAIDTASVRLVALDSVLDCDLSPTGALRVNTSNNYTYLWNNGSTNAQVDNLPAGAYTVTVSNSQNCNIVLMDTIRAPFVPNVMPFIEVFSNTSSTGNPGDDFAIGAGNDQTSFGVRYEWTTNSTDVIFANAQQANTTVKSEKTGVYQLLLTATANDATACQDTGSVILKVESIYLGMPTAFTPNGDGVNDLYRPTGLTEEDVVSFKIYNRWGQIVYQGDNLENGGWDGRFQGVEQPTEQYVFVLEYQLGTQKTQVRKGEFTLLR